MLKDKMKVKGRKKWFYPQEDLFCYIPTRNQSEQYEKCYSIRAFDKAGREWLVGMNAIRGRAYSY